VLNESFIPNKLLRAFERPHQYLAREIFDLFPDKKSLSPSFVEYPERASPPRPMKSKHTSPGGKERQSPTENQVF
jgi:hypothetical protein